MNPTLKKLLAPLASLWLTVVLLLMSMVVVLAGTTAQEHAGIWQVQSTYFHSFVTWIDFDLLFPLVKAKIPFGMPFPGGYTLIILLLANLLAAHTVRFKFTWKRTGVILVHLGLILLLLGEIVTSLFALETRMSITEGQSANWSADIREPELAVIDTSPEKHDAVAAIPEVRLQTGSVIPEGEQLPLTVKVEEYYPNSDLAGADPATRPTRATAGLGTGTAIVPRPRFTGAGDEASMVDMPSAYVTFQKGGQSVGTYLLSTLHGKGQTLNVDGKEYLVELRWRRYYKPFSLHLSDFSFDRYTGSSTPKNFSSRVRLIDPERGVDREVLIKMNEPLRYRGETYFQADWDKETEKTTILQVVRNPGWLAPYLACAVTALGMVMHFGLHLSRFFSKQSYVPATPAPAARPVPVLPADPRSRKKAKREKGAGARPELAAAQPWWGNMAWTFPIVVVAACGIYLLSTLRPMPQRRGDYDLRAFAQLPISHDGRVMPLDSLARNTLKVLSGKQSWKPDLKKGTRSREPIAWLAEMLAKPDAALDYPVFQVNHPQVVALLTPDPNMGPAQRRKLFTLHEVWTEGLVKEFERVRNVPARQRDLYDKKIAELGGKLNLYTRFLKTAKSGELNYLLDQGDVLSRQTPLDQSNPSPEWQQYMRQTTTAMSQIRMLERMNVDGLYVAPPRNGNEKWRPAEEIVLARLDPDGGRANFHAPAQQFFAMLDHYRAGNPEAFNRSIIQYEAELGRLAPDSMDKASVEVLFNRAEPFYACIILYVISFLLAVSSWLGWTAPLGRAAFWVLVLSFAVHTFGLVTRIYLSGRPPVTNLYSSAVFIAWGVLLLAGGLELIFRNGIGTVCAAIMGFLSLIIAHHLSAEGDTMRMLEAVLDTNFWLATHVVIITLGYAATFLAGLLGAIYVIRGVLTKSLGAELGKVLARMTYGVLCAAILFSFVGTVLGGLWADDSWGRFWGWDPKENGAILIVLWNAVVLHGRWGGILRERGVMLAAIFGNVVTAWSWFGTNMLGIGLHSYGFMDSAVFWLGLFVFSQFALIGIGLTPLSSWRSPIAQARTYGAARPPSAVAVPAAAKPEPA